MDALPQQDSIAEEFEKLAGVTKNALDLAKGFESRALAAEARVAELEKAASQNAQKSAAVVPRSLIEQTVKAMVDNKLLPEDHAEKAASDFQDPEEVLRALIKVTCLNGIAPSNGETFNAKQIFRKAAANPDPDGWGSVAALGRTS